VCVDGTDDRAGRRLCTATVVSTLPFTNARSRVTSADRVSTAAVRASTPIVVPPPPTLQIGSETTLRSNSVTLLPAASTQPPTSMLRGTETVIVAVVAVSADAATVSDSPDCVRQLASAITAIGHALEECPMRSLRR